MWTPLVEVFARPGLFAHIELERFEALFERLKFAPFAPGLSMFRGQFLQIGAHESGECGVPIKSNLSDFLDHIIVDGEGDVHRPIIREAHNKGQTERAR